jgi:hypothetical protein
MASVFKRMRDRRRKEASWHIAYADENGIRRTVKGFPDKTATETMARKLESEAELRRRRGIIDPRTDAYVAHESRPLADHLTDFRRSLEAKGGTRKHAMVTAHRAERILSLARARRISDLSLSKALDALAALRDEGLSAKTIQPMAPPRRPRPRACPGPPIHEQLRDGPPTPTSRPDPRGSCPADPGRRGWPDRPGYVRPRPRHTLSAGTGCGTPSRRVGQSERLSGKPWPYGQKSLAANKLRILQAVSPQPAFLQGLAAKNTPLPG